jgi:hypothetical protein
MDGEPHAPGVKNEPGADGDRGAHGGGAVCRNLADGLLHVTNVDAVAQPAAHVALKVRGERVDLERSPLWPVADGDPAA